MKRRSKIFIGVHLKTIWQICSDGKVFLKSFVDCCVDFSFLDRLVSGKNKFEHVRNR